MAVKMKNIKEIARKRRARFRAKFLKLSITITEFANNNGMSRAAMSKHLSKANKEK